VVADAILGDLAQGVVERLHPDAAPVPEGLEAHLDPDPVPQRRQPRVVDLEHQARFGDQLVLLAQRLGERVEVLLVLGVVEVVAVDLEAGRRGGGEEGVRAGIGGPQELDLLAQRVVAAVAHRPGAHPAHAEAC
jgi:hypothetical protein